MTTRLQKIADGLEQNVYKDATHGKIARDNFIYGAAQQELEDNANPSDAVIMRILNAIGYEEESWIPFVRERLKAMEGEK